MGTWKLTERKSEFSPGAPRNRTVVYEAQGDKVKITVDSVGSDGKATYPVLAPRLKAEDFKGHALMVHAGGDNHSDHPEKLGGGGARVACGVVQ